MKFSLWISLILSLTGCSSEYTPKPERPKNNIISKLPSTYYSCTGSYKNVEVKYDNNFEYGAHKLSRAFVKLGYNGNYSQYRQVVAASGARYTINDSTWWTKGSSGFVSIESKDTIICRCREIISRQ